jgi:ABC-type glycerol-3-phosphate transport system substrate-binding protein
MMIDRNSPVPIYYQLKLHFKRQMEDGELGPGDRLPTEMELCERFEISRAPVRQAMTELAREGYLYRRPGQGTFVAPLTTSRVAEQTTLRVFAHYDIRWMATLEQAVLRWNSLHPEQEVQLDVSMCARPEFHQVLRRAAIRGEAPDIAPLDYVWVADYAGDGYVEALNHLDSVWVDTLYQDLEIPVIKNNTINGLLYGLPVQADVTGMWYRKDWFAQEGLVPPQTWNEWLELLDYFAEPDVRERLGHSYSLVLPVTSQTGEATVNLLIAFIWLAGGQVVGSDGLLALDSESVYEALHFLQKITLERRSYLPSSVYRSRWWDMIRSMAQDVVPMALGGTYEWPRIREESAWADEEMDAMQHLGFILMPRPSLEVAPVASLGGTSWAIFRQSEKQDLCMEILKIAASPMLSSAFCEENLQISPRISVNAELTCAEHPWLRLVVPYLASARNRPVVRNYLRLSRFLREMFEKVLWDGLPVEETVQQTARLLELLTP